MKCVDESLMLAVALTPFSWVGLASGYLSLCWLILLTTPVFLYYIYRLNISSILPMNRYETWFALRTKESDELLVRKVWGFVEV